MRRHISGAFEYIGKCPTSSAGQAQELGQEVPVVREPSMDSIGSQRLKTVPLRRDHFMVAMPADHPRAGERGKASLADFRDETWVCSSASLPWTWARTPVRKTLSAKLLTGK